jgi:hypothetical protein
LEAVSKSFPKLRESGKRKFTPSANQIKLMDLLLTQPPTVVAQNNFVIKLMSRVLESSAGAFLALPFSLAFS